MSADEEGLLHEQVTTSPRRGVRLRFHLRRGKEGAVAGYGAHLARMTKFEMDEKALQRAAGDAVKRAVKAIDQDMPPYRGRGADQVEPALERSTRRHGVTPDPRGNDFQKMVEVISTGGTWSRADRLRGTAGEGPRGRDTSSQNPCPQQASHQRRVGAF
ncbi:hypothetical protein MO973_29390 [Paenibacillus sp. TRM 82003]|uniref:hypothetical protein n=1 Tax=Kineococcus sp. TRM81007 TaxID=2925831 RepID=UPI001F57E149|nr:hypothetical protein [Kineococcus sp. TRM81007]MCI2240573.1 hypothetical protein [Kineococcus sp. TRM81007]MCI3924343.1 hypothetical protein [Paenibacillus sp. TRM 82003]